MRISKSHELGVDEARRRVDKIAEELQKRYQLTSKWEGDHMRVTGTSITGLIRVADKDIHVEVNLGLALLMVEGRIRSGIEEAINEHLA